MAAQISQNVNLETLQDSKHHDATEDLRAPPVIPTETPQNVYVYPDGGREALTVLFGCFCMGFAGSALLNCPGSFQAWLADNQLSNHSPGKIGWIFGFYYFMSFFAGIQIGPIFDAYGPRPWSILASILLLVTYLVMGVCTEYWHFFLTIGLVGGIASSLSITCAIGTVQHWFFKYRGLATGGALCGGSISGVVFPLVLQSLLPKIGFAWTTRVISLLILPFMGLAVLLMRSRFSSSTRSASRRRLFLDYTVFKSPEIICITIGTYFLEWGLFIVLSYISSYALAQGMSFELSYQLLAFLNAGGFIGRWIPGYIGDRCGRFNTQIVSLALCMLSIFAIWLPGGKNQAAVIAFAVIFGITSGSNLSLTPVCLGQLCEIEKFGRTYTIVYSIASIGALTSTPLAGEILQADGKYRGLILFAGASYAVSLFSFIAVRVMKVGWDPRLKY